MYLETRPMFLVKKRSHVTKREKQIEKEMHPGYKMNQ